MNATPERSTVLRSLSPTSTRLLALALLSSGLGAFAQEGGFAIHCAKAITCAADVDEPQFINDAVLLVAGSEILEIGPRAEVEIPDDFEVVDYGDAWIVPGMIDLHSHIGHMGMLADWHVDIHRVNPELRVSSTVEPANYLLKRAVAGGVTTVLYIPGSATNMSGAGILMKTAPELYEDSLIRDPGSLKIAQAGNPESWAIPIGRAFMNWNMRRIIRRGIAYAKEWEAFERGEAEEPMPNTQLEIFRALRKKETQVSIHTQWYQVVMTSLTMLRQEFGFDIYIDHGTFDGFRAAALAQELGVPAILGPRSVSRSVDWPGFAQVDHDGRTEGIAANYQERGHEMLGFNTDAINFMDPSSPWTEELPLQGAMGARYGMTNENLEVLRGLTIVPAITAGIDGDVGSLEAGKDADLVVIQGDPTDPRNRVECVYVNGEIAYAREDDPSMW